MTGVVTVGRTGNQDIDGLLDGIKWASPGLTYSFPASASYYGAGYSGGEPLNNFAAFNPQQRAAAQAALKEFASVANLTFSELTETAVQHADLRLALSDMPSTAWAYFPAVSSEGGDAWFNNSAGLYRAPVEGSYAYYVFVHEIGHALGLKHSHEVGSNGAVPAAHDTMEYTVMSYRSYVGASTSAGYVNEAWGYAQSLMTLDIAALQHLYGANYATNNGNTVYSWSPSTGEQFINGAGQGAPGGNRIFMTVWDGGGVDTYDFSNYVNGLTVDLTPGNWTTVSASQLAKLHYNGSQIADGNIANALLYNNDQRSLIENANGGPGNDVIKGNIANNILNGGAGNDTLSGGTGNDTLDGGAGSDTLLLGGGRSQYQVTHASDGSIYVTDLRPTAGEGTDTLRNIETVQFSDGVHSLLSLVSDQPATIKITPQADDGDGDRLFDTAYYNQANPDVLKAGANARTHYSDYGWHEGRDPSAYFDTDYYLTHNPDVARAGMNPLEHYRTYGWKEGRDASSRFDTSEYLAHNPDVGIAGMNPLEHFLAYGLAEGRQAWPLV